VTIDDFIAQNKGKWERLSQLVNRSSGSGIRRMAPDELDALGELYRTVASDFALAQRDFAGQPVVTYLNQLVARAHAAVYRGRPTQALNLVEFLLITFPRTFRQLAPFIALAFLIFTVPAVVSGVLIYRDPSVTEWTFSEGEKELIPIVKRGELWIDLPPEERPAASAFIMTNNIQVSLLALAGGASAGLVTLYVVLLNGLSFGGIMGLCFHYGVGWRLVNWVAGHGVVELTVIFMAAGAGLRLAWAIVHPGTLSRRDALILATRQAIVLAGGAIPLLVLAGAIEGFVSPHFNPLYSALAGILSGAVTCAWVLLGGRSVEHLNVPTF
jgi:uncharacterized membrane protein SpoIIM required for sporulation